MGQWCRGAPGGEGNPSSTLISPSLPPFPAGRGCCTEPYLQNLKQGGGGGLQRLEATLGRGGRAEPAGLAGAQGFFSQRWWLTGSMAADGPRWEDRRLSPTPSFSPVTAEEGTAGLGKPRGRGEEEHVVCCTT